MMVAPDGERWDDAAPPLAPMSVVETILITLVEKGVLDWDDVSEALESAVAAHDNAAPDQHQPENHRQAAAEIVALIGKLGALECARRTK